MKPPQFKIGQEVHFKNGGRYDTGIILAFTYTKDDHLKDGEYHWLYTVSTKELDLKKKEIIEGVSHALENELEEVQQGGSLHE